MKANTKKAVVKNCTKQKLQEIRKRTCQRKPSCCEACGNPAYPECKDSCPIFDD